MALAVITYDASDYAGVDFDPRRTKVYATNNAYDGVVHDVLGNHQYIGSGNGTIAADGSGSISVPIPGAGYIPATWQTTIHFDGPDRNSARGRTLISFGPYTITASGTLGALIEEQGIPPEYAGQLVAEMEAIRDETALIAGLTGEDAAVAFLVEDAGSDTAAALSATYVAHTADSAATDALIASLAPGAPYAITQRVPFDIYVGVA